MGGLVFWNSIHLEVASNPFCLLCNCPWLLVFALCLFFMILLGFNLYCWKGIHFSWNNFLIFLLLFLGLIVVSSFFLQDYISFIFSSVFFFVVFFFGVVVFHSKIKYFLSLRVSEIHLFYNLQLFYWH